MMRCRTTTETNRKGDRVSIIVSEIPYQVNKKALLERIADLVREKTIEGIGDLRIGRDRYGVNNHATLGTLYLIHLRSLLLDTEITMNDADSSLLSHRNREARLGHRIHRRADDGDILVDISRQSRLRADVRRNYVRVGGQQQNIVEGERLRDGKMNHSTLTCFSPL